MTRCLNEGPRRQNWRSPPGVIRQQRPSQRSSSIAASRRPLSALIAACKRASKRATALSQASASASSRPSAMSSATTKVPG